MSLSNLWLAQHWIPDLKGILCCCCLDCDPSDGSSNDSCSSDEIETTPSESVEVNFDEEILKIDRSSDKNNLYFKKPYKVFIPK